MALRPYRQDHIGASGLVFGLIVFLILSGLLERRPVPLLIALFVGFLYGGTLLWGIVPRQGDSPGTATSAAWWPAAWSLGSGPVNRREPAVKA